MVLSSLTLIICTKDRPKYLTNLLRSIQAQTRLPDRILIIDGSDRPIQHVLRPFSTLALEYYPVRPPSLPKQRNVGISKLNDEQGWVGFLDDDLELFPDTLENIEKFIQREEMKGERPLGGVRLTIDDKNPIAYSKWRLFWLLDKSPGGRFSLSGFPSPIHQSLYDQDIQWMPGGASFWRAKVLMTYSFDEWFEGTGYYEDIDYSYRVSQKYRLALSSKSCCLHHFQPPIKKKKIIQWGTWQIVGWWYFVRKTRAFSVILVFWSMLGMTLGNLGIGLIRPKTQRWYRGLGHLQGLFLILTGNGLKRRKFLK